MKLSWRVLTFLVTLIFIYLLFPILIVPSSLPAIQEMVTGGGQGDINIYQLEIERVPTLQDPHNTLVELHQQGMDIILNR